MRTLACLQCCFMLLPSHTHRVTPTQYTLRAYLQLLDLRLQLALPMPLTCYVATCIGFVVVRSMRLRPTLTVPCPELVTCIRAGEANGEGGARRDATCDPTCPPRDPAHQPAAPAYSGAARGARSAGPCLRFCPCTRLQDGLRLRLRSLAAQPAHRKPY